jgi:Lon protease-like protein
MNGSDSLPAFSGRARLFPLPNLVLFPHAMQPLHIFEPRYRQMTSDALEGDRLIAMVLPLPGWEKDYAGSPAIHRVACLGQIVAEHPLEDGRFNLLLRGVQRIRIDEEFLAKKLYRTARCTPLQETPIADAEAAESWRRVVRNQAARWFRGNEQVGEQIHKLLDSDLPLGALCDIISFALPLDPNFKQTLLEELDVEARWKMLNDYVEGEQTLGVALKRKFPPEFSVN